MSGSSFKDSEENGAIFYNDMKARVEYHLIENDLTYAEVVGTLEILKADVLNRMYEETYMAEIMEDDDYDDDW